MTEAPSPLHDYGEAGEARLRAFVEHTVGGKVTRMERQVRWRPAWFVDVEKDGVLISLYLRGERAGDVSIFPELKREADIMTVLEAHGILVPHIYGFCPEPPAILMAAMTGSREVATAHSDAERQGLARQFIAAVAAMHKIPVEAFTAIGLELPEGPEAVVLAGLNAYLPLYQRTKRKPEPFIDFVLSWISRNVPQHRGRPSFIQFDSGQFLHEAGQMTGLYDFEFSMFGDPMTDLATMRMREAVEPLGDEMRNICKYYEEFSGQPIDHDAIEFHTLLFAIISVMQFAGTVSVPQPGDPHSIYLAWDLSLRQVVLLSMRNLTGLEPPPQTPLVARRGDNAALIAKLSDTIASIEVHTDLDADKKASANELLEWLNRADEMGAEVMRRDLADVSELIGRSFTEWSEAELALEAYVKAADAEQDERLFMLFSAIEARRMLLFGPTAIGKSARSVYLAPTR